MQKLKISLGIQYSHAWLTQLICWLILSLKSNHKYTDKYSGATSSEGILASCLSMKKITYIPSLRWLSLWLFSLAMLAFEFLLWRSERKPPRCHRTGRSYKVCGFLEFDIFAHKQLRALISTWGSSVHSDLILKRDIKIDMIHWCPYHMLTLVTKENNNY